MTREEGIVKRAPLEVNKTFTFSNCISCHVIFTYFLFVMNHNLKVSMTLATVELKIIKENKHQLHEITGQIGGRALA